MSLPRTDEGRLIRLALLTPERIEMIHPLAPAHMLIGYSILKDECWSKGDGLDMLHALERRANINFHVLRNKMLRAVSGKL